MFVKEHPFCFYFYFLNGRHIFGSEHYKVNIKIKISGWEGINGIESVGA